MARGQKVTVAEARPVAQYNVDLGIHNRFDVEVRGADGEIRQKAVGHNIILNSRWNATYFSTGSWFSYIHYGGGTGALDPARTTLFTWINGKAGTNLKDDFTHFNDGYASYRKEIRIEAGEIAGQTLREVGIGASSANNSLMTHALLKDMNGNPVSILVSDLDIITIYATVYIRFDLRSFADKGIILEAPAPATHFFRVVAGVHGSGTYYTNVFQYFKAHAGQELFDTTKIDGGGAQKLGLVSYDVANKKVFFKASLAAGASYRIGVADLNASFGGGWGGISTFYDSVGANSSGLRIIFPNSVKPFTVITDEPIGTGDGSTLDFKTKFGFIRNDGSFAIKINGSVVNSANYSIDYGLPPLDQIGFYAKRIERTRKLWLTYTYIAGGYEIVENPFYQRVGYEKMSRSSTGNNVIVDVSNDLITWIDNAVTITGYQATPTIIPSEYQKYRYWRVKPAGSAIENTRIETVTGGDVRHIHFKPGYAPPAGAAITASYHTECIPKDDQHVVDLELTITLNEYQGV